MAACRTVLIAGLLLGDGTAYRLGAIGGLGVPDVRANDVPRGHASGDVGQNDYYEPRNITIEVSIGPPVSPDVTTVLDNWDLLDAAWQATNVDQPIVFTYPGRVWTFLGRTRGAALDDTKLADGLPYVRAQLAFRALDPTRY